MKWISEDFKSLRALWVNQLRVMLSAEELILRELPNMFVRATDEQLQAAIRKHVEETEEHLVRLERILQEEQRKNPAADAIGPIKCKAIAAMGAETENLVVDAREAWVRDAGLIAAAQRMEHYEIASYGALRQWARLLGEFDAAELLNQTLHEEGHVDHLLTSIADRVNPKAKAA